MRRFIALTVLMFALLAGSAEAATTLHVNGSTGTNSGTCASSPCKTISYAVTQGESLSAPVTIDVSAGTYPENVVLGSADSGLTIDGAGDGTSPATDTIIAPPSALGISTDVSGNASSLDLEHLEISQANGAPAVYGVNTAVTITDVGIDVTGPGLGLDMTNGGSVTGSGGSITLSNTGAGSAIDLGGANASVQLTGTPVNYGGDSPTIQADAVTLTSSPVTNTDTTAGTPVIYSNSGSVMVTDSPIDEKGDGVVFLTNGPVTVTGSPITSENTSDSSPAFDSPGTVSVSGAPIVYDGTGEVVTAPAADLSDLQITQDNPGADSPTLALADGPSTLSKVTLTSDTIAPLLYATGSLSIIDSTITSAATTGASQALDLTGSASTTSNISLTGTKVTQQDDLAPIATISNANTAFDSSELLGGLRTTFNAQSGKTDTLMIASSTIDVGQLGVRDSATDGFASVAADGGSSGTNAVVNVEGSILVEAPELSGDGSLNCSDTEVPTTTQVANASQGAINCGDTNENTYTQSLSAIFQDPGVNYAPNPSWSGVDSVPASAISLPSPFTDSSTDVLGNPRVVNGKGTCTPGIRDKGAIELQDHAGVVPDPSLTGTSTATVGKLESYSAKAANTSAQFSWTSSDGGTGSGASFSHKFKRAGKFTVTVTATGATDCVGRASKTVTVVGVDAITHLSVSPKKLKTKATISYRAGASATTTLTIELKTKKGYKAVKRLTHHDKAGKVKIALRRGRLKPGRYRIVAQSKNGAGKSKAASATFTVTG
jgi:fibronectin-binding autotransporter adhesin